MFHHSSTKCSAASRITATVATSVIARTEAGIATSPPSAPCRCSQVGIGESGWGNNHIRYMKNETESPPAPSAASQ